MSIIRAESIAQSILFFQFNCPYFSVGVFNLGFCLNFVKISEFCQNFADFFFFFFFFLGGGAHCPPAPYVYETEHVKMLCFIITVSASKVCEDLMTSLHYDSIFVGINVSRVIYSSMHRFIDSEGINFRTLHLEPK